MLAVSKIFENMIVLLRYVVSKRNLATFYTSNFVHFQLARAFRLSATQALKTGHVPTRQSHTRIVLFVLVFMD